MFHFFAVLGRETGRSVSNSIFLEELPLTEATLSFSRNAKMKYTWIRAHLRTSTTGLPGSGLLGWSLILFSPVLLLFCHNGSVRLFARSFFLLLVFWRGCGRKELCCSSPSPSFFSSSSSSSLSSSSSSSPSFSSSSLLFNGAAMTLTDTLTEDLKLNQTQQLGMSWFLNGRKREQNIKTILSRIQLRILAHHYSNSNNEYGQQHKIK